MDEYSKVHFPPNYAYKKVKREPQSHILMYVTDKVAVARERKLKPMATKFFCLSLKIPLLICISHNKFLHSV
jgi:hypothetical protein